MSSVLSAQSGFGIRVGGNLANQNIKIQGTPLSVDPLLGLDLGILYHAEIGSGWSLQPELHFAQAGASYQNIEAHIDYFQLPLLLQYDVLNENDNMDVKPFIGPYASYGLSGEAGGIEYDFDGDVKRVDFGAQFGIMINFACGFFADIRYGLGLADISDADILGQETEAKNQILGFGIGYIFK